MEHLLVEHTSADAGAVDRLGALLRARAGLLPESLVSAGAERMLGPPSVIDLNETVEGGLSAVAERLTAADAVVTCILDPAIGAVAAGADALRLLTASLIAQVAGAKPRDDDLATAVEVVTGQAGSQVCLEVSRLAVDVRRARWPLRDLADLLARHAGGDLELVLERDEMTAALRLPTAPWTPVSGQVLVLDDDRAVSEVACRMVEQIGLSARAVRSLDELVSHLAGADQPSAAPQMLVLVESGFRDARRGPAIEWLARRRPEVRDRLVVLTWSPWMRETRRALAALGREWYLAKPFAAETLTALVRRRLMCLEGRR